jgi:GntR family transcriptional regulator
MSRMVVNTHTPRTLIIQLDEKSGVPVYRQIIDQIMGGIATGAVKAGDQLPTVRQLAVDLAINPNTVIRAYRELEIRGMLETQQGTGTFISHQKVQRDDAERQRKLSQIVGEFTARAGAAGFSAEELLERLQSLTRDEKKNGDEGKKRR